MPQEKIYKNWKAVTEADFVSLFIKTWFAYILLLELCFQRQQTEEVTASI